MTDRLPTVFVSHGAPTLALEDGPARRFLAGLGGTLGRPQGILCVSAHWETAGPTVGVAVAPDTIHDFYGFGEDLARITYPAPGSPDLGRTVSRLLAEAGIPCERDGARGLDHGAWVPLMLMYPEADIPVAQLSIQPAAGAAAHLAMGRALAGLRDEGILVLGSGGAVHNLRQVRFGGGPAADWAETFDAWLDEVLAAGDAETLVHTWTDAPGGRQAHPRDEHLLPLPVALGAAGPEAKGRTLHRGFEHGSLGMAAYAFE